MKKNDTSWGPVAGWYDDYLKDEDTYQAQVIAPNLMRVLNLQKDERVLDLACGQGYFTREAKKFADTVIGADISKELVSKARAQTPGTTFYAAPASKLSFAKDHEFDAVLCVLALQNMEDLSPVFKEVKRVLKPGGRFVFVLNHPAFRVLKRSSWGFDEEAKAQYRRVDGYLSAAKVSIDMHPGKKAAKETISYHRSLQDFFKALAGAGLAATRLEEWISHRESQKGPRQRAEDAARREIPLFMCIEARNI
jgi:ubiquinone/menaquinone biosynthesis C-methylase UbiE